MAIASVEYCDAGDLDSHNVSSVVYLLQVLREIVLYERTPVAKTVAKPLLTRSERSQAQDELNELGNGRMIYAAPILCALPHSDRSRFSDTLAIV